LLLWSAGRIVWKKARRIQRYYFAMRSGLGKLYSAPVIYDRIDLPADETPTLHKCIAELGALGARHVCDIRVPSARGIQNHFIFSLGDTTWAIALLRQTENLLFFPPRPVMIASARFTDGRRHYTVNCARARKRTLSNVSVRCILESDVGQMLSLHQRRVDRLIASGAIPTPPPTTAEQAIEQMQREHAEARKGWQSSPYSWGDAIHDAFKLCRREYLKD
jgi:hypothetical protein